MDSSWRWDQGRLEYFSFENLKAIASCLADLDGIEINPKDDDPLRFILELEVGLSFSPANYRVWRNYARVFGCSLLATKAGQYLFVSDVCRKLADGSIQEVDEYLTILVERFRYPSPVFDSYDIKERQVFPFLALLKYLLSRSANTALPQIRVEDVFDLIIGNGCNGLEPEAFYVSLKAPVFGHKAIKSAKCAK